MRKKEVIFYNINDLGRLLLIHVAPRVTKEFWLQVIQEYETTDEIKETLIARLDRVKLIHEAGIKFVKLALQAADRNKIFTTKQGNPEGK